MMKRVFTAFLCVALTLAIGAIGAIGSAQAPAFYAELVRPDWAPPAKVFGPVWTTLYVLIGIALYLVWSRRTTSPSANSWLGLFAVQLAVNAVWSWLFFEWRLGLWAFVDCALLAVLVGVLVWRARPVSGVAALLLLPYLAWVSFATVLSWTMWQLNPALLG
ncbi:MAG: TspO/MBR family protein [Limnobacter sp.]|uniref:TspO/MBR family protein n=1 Tax=Limnobacter sp. TaxID=2003368 RepID=UPI00391C2C6C